MCDCASTKEDRYRQKKKSVKMCHELFAVFVLTALMFSDVVCANSANYTAADDYIQVHRLVRLALTPFSNATEGGDFPVLPSRTFQLELPDPLTTYTITVEPQPIPIWPSSRVILLNGDKIMSDEPASKFTRRIYAGEIADNLKSSVVGTFSDGIFEGIVHFGDDDDDNTVLHVEPNSDVVGFNAIAYWSYDVLGEGDHGIPVRSRSLRSQWLPLPKEHFARRSRRQAADLETTVHLCNLSIVVDPLYFRFVAGANTDQVMREVVTNVFYADAHFRHADLNEDGHSDGYGFRVSAVIMQQEADIRPEFYTDKALVYTTYEPEGLFRQMFAYLDSFKDHCAGLYFTYRLSSPDESRGISQVKVSFTHDVQSSGVCSKTMRGDLIPLGHLNDYTKYLKNALPVNFYVGGARASTALAISSIVHQLAHLMHAGDDDEAGDAACRSTEFFMNSPISEVSANSRFSHCSLRSMNEAIQRKKKTEIYCLFGCVLRSGDCNSAPLQGGTTFEPLTTPSGNEPPKKIDKSHEVESGRHHDPYYSGTTMVTLEFKVISFIVILFVSFVLST